MMYHSNGLLDPQWTISLREFLMRECQVMRNIRLDMARETLIRSRHYSKETGRIVYIERQADYKLHIDYDGLHPITYFAVEQRDRFARYAMRDLSWAEPLGLAARVRKPVSLGEQIMLSQIDPANPLECKLYCTDYHLGSRDWVHSDPTMQFSYTFVLLEFPDNLLSTGDQHGNAHDMPEVPQGD